MQEAFLVALERWPADGIPANPGAWITRVARNRAIDRIRRARTFDAKRPQLERLEELRLTDANAFADPAAAGRDGEEAVEDDVLRLCSPAVIRRSLPRRGWRSPCARSEG